MSEKPSVPPGCRCGICGKPSVTFDSWFTYYPCDDHKHLTPNEYQDAAREKVIARMDAAHRLRAEKHRRARRNKRRA